LRILHCPLDVGGNAWTLSRAERKLGIKSDVMVFNRSWLGYPADFDLNLEHTPYILKILKLTRFFIRAIINYDVFHFNFGTSLMPGLRSRSFLELCDLPILRLFGKKVIVTFQGCDARQKDFCIHNFVNTACNETDCCGGICNTKSDASKRNRIGKWDRYAHKIYSLNPDLLNILPFRSVFLPYAATDISEWQEDKRVEKKYQFIILHAPTNRVVKGTKHIIAAVDRLKSEYDFIDLVLVENIPHNQVKELYNKADIVVDQLLIGWYGGFAVEAMALAKPVVCYIREEDLQYIPQEMRHDLPIIHADPESIYRVLREAIVNRHRLSALGKKSRIYVEKWHDPVKIAVTMKQVYESLF
jgi:hypothetical protein